MEAGSWKRPHKVLASLECSLQPDAEHTGMRHEVDICYAATSLKGSAQHLYCQRGQMENLIKLDKLASDFMSCHSATASQVRLALHTAAFRLMHAVRTAIAKTSSLATAEFATIRAYLIRITARDRTHRAYPRPAAAHDDAAPVIQRWNDAIATGSGERWRIIPIATR